jgi:uncharacterized membrane-anchored protein
MSSSEPAPTSTVPTHHALASKVPVVTAAFWILKILTTGMGEAASDALVRAGGAVAVAGTAVALVVSFVLQFRASRYVPWIYWLTVAMIGIFGTMAADLPHFLGVPVWVISAVYLTAVLMIFYLWHRAEGTLSFDSINTRRRETFYWAAVVATFALGTAVGDWTAQSWGLGNLGSGIMFAALILLPVAARRWLGFDAVAAFWIAYVLTRPLGASFADWMGSPTGRGGLGFEMAYVAVGWLLAIAAFVAYLAVTREDARTDLPSRQGQDDPALR